ncbi:hypothetical protein [Photobacterium sanctipauli]|uniref:hypothetical protein n=1 Tax=Photobacterium sanctipauli TaxID=1342794 RepID=UPI001304A9CE|nr:hypothetical protein [Photobacterium sanctipauli]
MNDKEILRLSAIRDVCEHRIRRSDPARVLSLSVRQVQCLPVPLALLINAEAQTVVE